MRAQDRRAPSWLLLDVVRGCVKWCVVPRGEMGRTVCGFKVSTLTRER